MKKLKAALLGCGDRGNVYASHAIRNPDEMEIVAVIDIDSVVLNVTGDKFSIPNSRRYKDVDAFLADKIECDTVINATMDPAHYETTKKLIAAGYNILLEKPIVNNENQLLELKNLADEKGVSILVCHVLRYTPFYREIKKIINSGRIGKILTMEMNEHVWTVHFANSFVRGKWSDESVCGSGLLLQKCCHDTDLMCWLNNQTTPEKVFSFGNRSFFIPDNAPEDATEFCYQCPHKESCIYDAKTIHLDCEAFSFQTWRGLNKPYDEISYEEKEEFLKHDDYGRCVFKLKRNLVDKQNVTVQFKNGSIGTLTVVGGSTHAGRDVNIVGSKGEIRGRFEDNKFTVYEFIHNGKEFRSTQEVVDVTKCVSEGSGHGNGDICIMRDYVRYLNGDASSISITEIDDSVNSHLCVYAAEQSRKENKAIFIG